MFHMLVRPISTGRLDSRGVSLKWSSMLLAPARNFSTSCEAGRQGKQVHIRLHITFSRISDKKAGTTSSGETCARDFGQLLMLFHVESDLDSGSCPDIKYQCLHNGQARWSKCPHATFSCCPVKAQMLLVHTI